MYKPLLFFVRLSCLLVRSCFQACSLFLFLVFRLLGSLFFISKRQPGTTANLPGKSQPWGVAFVLFCEGSGGGEGGEGRQRLPATEIGTPTLEHNRRGPAQETFDRVSGTR